jgi:hypothetical protein
MELRETVKQEEFESLKEAVSGALGDALYKIHDTQHQATVAPITTAINSDIAFISSCTNNNQTRVDGLAEVQWF